MGALPMGPLVAPPLKKTPLKGPRRTLHEAVVVVAVVVVSFCVTQRLDQLTRLGKQKREASEVFTQASKACTQQTSSGRWRPLPAREWGPRKNRGMCGGGSH